VRAGGTILLAALSLSAGPSLVACFDLLHSTADVRTACEIDASYPGCIQSATETDFCAWTPPEARQHAIHACAWLGACETPMGRNAFGPCVFQALLAYDCASNPNHPVAPEIHGLWDCLQRAGTCDDIDACISQRTGTRVCKDTGDYTACNGDLRVHCTDGGVKPYAKAAGSENCALWGKSCAMGTSDSECAGSASGLSCHAGDPKECIGGSSLRWCETVDGGGPDATGIDLGIDCPGNGATRCGGFPTQDAARWVACKADSDAAGGRDDCTPDPAATCQGGRATSCPSGVRESIDCATLLGSPGAAGACLEGTLKPPFDWTSPCAMTAPECANDSCDGKVVRSCERGAAFSVNCEQEGLKDCRLQAIDPASGPRAACSPP
jgi:hypothetical protein